MIGQVEKKNFLPKDAQENRKTSSHRCFWLKFGEGKAWVIKSYFSEKKNYFRGGVFFKKLFENLQVGWCLKTVITSDSDYKNHLFCHQLQAGMQDYTIRQKQKPKTYLTDFLESFKKKFWFFLPHFFLKVDFSPWREPAFGRYQFYREDMFLSYHLKK